jgi:hypothetical protein
VKILSLEIFCPELQLDFVVAHPTGIHYAFAEVQRDLLRWSEGRAFTRQVPRLLARLAGTVRRISNAVRAADATPR